jgi:nicotinate-nucleotide pyrophosphorylase (carboxylating)
MLLKITDNPQLAYPKALLKAKLISLLETDLGFGDLSSTLIPSDANGEAVIRAKSEGIIAGVEEAKIIFELCDVEVIIEKNDGQSVKKGDIIFKLKGLVRNILMAERTALNFIMKLSSIATSTADYVQQIRRKGLSTIIAATRKVTPGFGWFEKKAVILGGGDPHRWNLSDMVMLKDTHLKYYQGDLTKMIQIADAQTSFSKKIEVEIEKPEDIQTAIAAGADIIMLDNMTPEMIKAHLIPLKKDQNLKILFEASGNITEKNFLAFADAGIDIISTSQLIFHPHIHMDFSLRLV